MRRRVLRAALLAYPRDLRRTEGPVLLALAEELIEDGWPVRREVLGLLGGGLSARLRLTGVPWAAAFDRLAFPLAALLLAAMICGSGFDTYGGNWVGWTLGIGIGGALAALAGIAAGQRFLAVPGAVLVVFVCGLDGYRDLYGSGSRWVAFAVDVLPALLPAAILALAAAAVPRSPALTKGLWALCAALALVLVARLVRENTTTGTTVLAAGGALVCACLVASVRAGAAARAAAALALSAAAPAALWSVAAKAPADAAPAVLLGGAALTALVVVRLVRSARVPARQG